jgi:xanthine dehydrogenase YagS FAD-binding subunit
MRPFRYSRVESIAAAVAVADQSSRFVAGGTEILNWMKDGIEAPATLVDLGGLGLSGIRRDGNRLRIGATTTLAAIASDPLVRAEVPGLAGAIEASASPQIRSMGTIGGNLLQQTRCPYFRLPSPLGVGCELREPGSGCAARTGDHRAGAVLGDTATCLATSPSDPAVALAVLDPTLVVTGPAGTRSIGLLELYRAPPGRTALSPAELIVELVVPIGEAARTSRFLKVRDRASFDFALVSGAVASDGGGARLAFGGLAWGPWRCRAAEARLSGGRLDAQAVRAALGVELGQAVPLDGNRFKLELATRLAISLLCPEEASA